MKAAFEALVRSSPIVWVAKPANPTSPSHRAGTTARRSKRTQAKQAAASEKRTASSSGTGMWSSASFTIANEVPQTSVMKTRAARPTAGVTAVHHPMGASGAGPPSRSRGKMRS
jgi:hypothetical protein